MKLLELVTIENHNEKKYLHVKLFYEREIEIYWNIDDATALHLNSIYERNETHKYRLSLNYTYDQISEQYRSSFTKTYRDRSEPFVFHCSVEYINGLQAIRNCLNITEIIELPVIYTKLPALNETINESIIPEKSVDNEQNEVVVNNRKMANLSWFVAAISVVLIIVSILSYRLVNNANFDNPIVVAAQPNSNIIPVNLAMQQNIITPTVTTLVENYNASNLNFINTDDSDSITEDDSNSIIYSVPKGYVALTFDDGPSIYTKEITDILTEYDVAGTFFFLGLNAKKYPESVRYVVDSGYSIGNHSMSHYDMTRLTLEEQEKEILQAAEIIENITSTSMNLFRAPYGAINEQLIEVIQNHRYKIVHWNSDPEDWKTQDSDKIIKYIRNHDASGSIILLHESQAVIDALPTIIKMLLDQNLEIISL